MNELYILSEEVVDIMIKGKLIKYSLEECLDTFFKDSEQMSTSLNFFTDRLEAEECAKHREFSKKEKLKVHVVFGFIKQDTEFKLTAMYINAGGRNIVSFSNEELQDKTEKINKLVNENIALIIERIELAEDLAELSKSGPVRVYAGSIEPPEQPRSHRRYIPK